MGDVEEIKETLKKHHYSHKAIAEILKLYVNNSEGSNKKPLFQYAHAHNAHNKVRRSQMKIITDILTKTLNAATKTRIMYRANLNFLRFNRYFSKLLERGLIVKENDPNDGVMYYRTTEKGKDLLEVLKKAEELFPFD